MDENILTINRVDITEMLEDCLDRGATKDEIDIACQWVQKDFDYANVFEEVENIIGFRVKNV